MKWWRRRYRPRITEAQAAAELAQRRAAQAREMRAQAEAQAAAERRYLMPRLAGLDRVATQIERDLRRGRNG